MDKIRALLANKVKVICVVSLIFNLIFVGITIFVSLKNKNLLSGISDLRESKKEEELKERSRMNGVIAKEGEKGQDYAEIFKNNTILEGFNQPKMSELKFDEYMYDFKTSFKRYATKTPEGISVNIEKINNQSPYLVLYEPSEFLGVQSIEDLVNPIIGLSEDSKTYNSTFGGINFSKKYALYQPSESVRLQYKTVIRNSKDGSLYYLTFSSDWDSYPEKGINPEIWYKDHPSQNFQILDNYMKEITSK